MITGETDLVLYYAGTLPAGKGLVLGDKKNPNGFYINYASEWVDASALGWNALCLQAVVEVEGDVPANDLAVENIAFESAFAKIGEGANATVRIANYGFADASAPVLHYVAGAGEPAQMALEGTIAVGEYKEVNVQLPTASCTEGFNDVRCWIDSDDAVAFEIYKNILALAKTAHEKYVKLYGPITKQDLLQAQSYTWLKNPWPWDYCGKMEG